MKLIAAVVAALALGASAQDLAAHDVDVLALATRARRLQTKPEGLGPVPSAIWDAATGPCRSKTNTLTRCENKDLEDELFEDDEAAGDETPLSTICPVLAGNFDAVCQGIQVDNVECFDKGVDYVECVYSEICPGSFDCGDVEPPGPDNCPPFQEWCEEMSACVFQGPFSCTSDPNACPFGQEMCESLGVCTWPGPVFCPAEGACPPGQEPCPSLGGECNFPGDYFCPPGDNPCSPGQEPCDSLCGECRLAGLCPPMPVRDPCVTPPEDPTPTPRPVGAPTLRPTSTAVTPIGPAPAVTPAPTVTPAPAPAACADDPTWHKRGDENKNCEWVSANPSTRCFVKDEKAVLGAEGCLASCGSCGMACVDDEDWHKEGDANKDCVWVSRFSNRLAVLGEDGTYAYEACRAAGRTCEIGIVETSCGDDPTWHKRNEENKNCAWVSSAPETRCFVKNDRAVLAAEACKTSCGACGNACVDAPGWHKDGDVNKDCTWVSRFSNRLAVLGEDGTYAYQSCRRAARTCDDL